MEKNSTKRIGKINGDIEKGYFLNAFIEVALAASDAIIEDMEASGFDKVVIKRPFDYCTFSCYDKFSGEEGEYCLLRVRNGENNEKGLALVTFAGKYAVEELLSEKNGKEITEEDIDRLMEEYNAFETALDDYEVIRLQDASRIYDIACGTTEE